ncbi:hypothetical protein ACFQV8_35095 [Pseudonocardia benzenivorans]
MTEIGLILLGVIVVGGLVAFFMLRTTRGESPSDGPRTVGDLVRLKAESADRQDEPATAEQAPPRSRSRRPRPALSTPRPPLRRRRHPRAPPRTRPPSTPPPTPRRPRPPVGAPPPR